MNTIVEMNSSRNGFHKIAVISIIIKTLNTPANAENPMNQMKQTIKLPYFFLFFTMAMKLIKLKVIMKLII